MFYKKQYFCTLFFNYFFYSNMIIILYSFERTNMQLIQFYNLYIIIMKTTIIIIFYSKSLLCSKQILCIFVVMIAY